jgi:serine-type D-Ala-D-Ala carboxypeptidase/endopeptidase
MNLKSFTRAARKVPAIGIGTLSSGDIEYAALGSIAEHSAPESLTWEIGSITKVFTGILLADMSLRDEVDLDDPIGAHVPDEVAARMPELELQPTLADLSSHTAGLPRIPKEWFKRLRGSDDPYSQLTEDDVWDFLGPKTLRPRKRRSRYSNYGVGLLGQVLARAAGTEYPTLVTDRILDPLGMSATGFDNLAPVPGFRGKKPTPPWTFGALGAAGSLRSTLSDMIMFAEATIDPPAGTLGEAMVLARQPVFVGRVQQVGLGWMTRARPGNATSTTTWHNGGTFGGASFLAVDDVQRIAVIAFGNRGPRLSSPLDGAGWKLFDSLGTSNS